MIILAVLVLGLLLWVVGRVVAARRNASSSEEDQQDAPQQLSTWDEMEFDREVYGHDWFE